MITAGAATALRLHGDGTAADGGSAAGEAPKPAPGLAIPLSATAGQAPESGAPSSPGAATASGPPAPTTPGAPVVPSPGAPVVGSGPGAGTGGSAGGGVLGTPDAQGGASNAPTRPSTGAPPAPPGAASPSPGDPAPAPAYTAAPPPPPAYRTTPPPSFSPTPAYTAAPPPIYTPPPKYTTPPFKPPTEPVAPLPPRARLSNGGSVLYDQGALDQDGNPVVMARDDGSPAALWTLGPNQDGGRLLSNGATQDTKVLTLDETTSRTQLWRSPSNSPNQIWSFVPVAGGYMIYISKDSSRCLYAAGSSGPAAIRPCDGSPEQIWTVTAA